MKKKRGKKKKKITGFEEKVQMIKLAQKNTQTPSNYKMSKASANVHYNQRRK